MSHLTQGVPIDSPIHTANRLFDSDGPDSLERRALGELLTDPELADLERTIGGHGVLHWAAEIDTHPHAGESRKSRYRIACFLWNGGVTFRPEDLLRQDFDNRIRVIRAFRVFMCLSPTDPPITMLQNPPGGPANVPP